MNTSSLARTIQVQIELMKKRRYKNAREESDILSALFTSALVITDSIDELKGCYIALNELIEDLSNDIFKYAIYDDNETRDSKIKALATLASASAFAKSHFD